MTRLQRFLTARLADDAAYAREQEAAGADARRLWAEISAKHRLLDLYTDTRERARFLEGWLETTTVKTMTPAQREAQGEMGRELREVEQRAVAYWHAMRAVAAVYAEHDDYRPLW